MKMVFENVKEAANMLLDLAKTPQLCNLHFEVDIGLSGIPQVTYTVKRLAISKQEETE